MMPSVQILQGDALEVLKTLPDESVHCCVTSPPYWGLRDYGMKGQLGLEKTPEEYVAKMVAVFREVRRVLREDGTLWLNIGDSYCSQGGLHDFREDNQPNLGCRRVWRDGCGRADGVVDERGQRNRNGVFAVGFKPKDLIGIPWRVAFALQGDGWWLRQDIIWHKPNPMPESVTDRCTKAHEYVFLLAKSERYFYDANAIRDPLAESSVERLSQDVSAQRGSNRVPGKTNGAMKAVGGMRRSDLSGFGLTRGTSNPSCVNINGANKRSVWTVPTQSYSEAHFATFPPDLIKPCILAGCPIGGTVLDPFFGSGTSGMVALELGRSCIGIELNPEYIKLAEARTNVTPGLQLA